MGRPITNGDVFPGRSDPLQLPPELHAAPIPGPLAPPPLILMERDPEHAGPGREMFDERGRPVFRFNPGELAFAPGLLRHAIEDELTAVQRRPITTVLTLGTTRLLGNLIFRIVAKKSLYLLEDAISEIIPLP